MSIRLRFLGDNCLDGVLDDVSLDWWEEADLCMANLETPVLPALAQHRPKAGPTLGGAPFPLFGIREAMGELVVNVANNHIMDYGDAGLEATLEVCRAAGIRAFGAGSNRDEAEARVVLDVKGVRLTVLGRCETQFGSASVTRAGAATLDPALYRDIAHASANSDIVVLSIHGASEMSPWPSPKWQDLLRSYIDAGADIIHGHHAHVPQGFERYGEGLIFYGLGNFLVDPDTWPGEPNTVWSLVPECRISPGNVQLEAKTAVIERQVPRVLVRPSTHAESERHMAHMDLCNGPLSDRRLLAGLWQEVAVELYQRDYARWLGFTHSGDGNRPPQGWRLPAVKNALRKRLWPRRRSPDRQRKLLRWYHLFACESHADAISTALGVLSGELEDLRTDLSRELFLRARTEHLHGPVRVPVGGNNTS